MSREALFTTPLKFDLGARASLRSSNLSHCGNITRPVLGSSVHILLTGISEGLPKLAPGDRRPALTDRARVVNINITKPR